jgi:hypothetical protein
MVGASAGPLLLVIFLDALHLKLRPERHVERCAVYDALALNMGGCHTPGSSGRPGVLNTCPLCHCT